MDSLKVFLVTPIEYEKRLKRIHNYKRIKIEELSKKSILGLYISMNFKEAPSVTDIPEGFIIQYKTKPAILISKENGKLYSFPGKWPIREIEHQASLVMRVLSRVNLVEKHERKAIMRGFQGGKKNN